MRHILKKHQHDSGFVVQCKVGNCRFSCTKWVNFKQHCRRKHDIMADYGHATVQANVPYEDEAGPSHQPDDLMQANVHSSRAQQNIRVAQFLLSLEAKHKLTKAAVQAVYEGMTDVVNDSLNSLRDKVLNSEVSPAELSSNFPEILRSCGGDTLQLFGTDHLRKSFYKNHFLHVEPEEVFLGESVITGKTKKHHAHIVPFLPMVKAILNMPEICHEFQAAHGNKRDSRSDSLVDFADGSFLKDHALGKDGKQFVQVILSYDDVELQNPLRSNKTHKLAMFYFTLSNIPVSLRSRLGSIFLIAIARSIDVKKFGLHCLLDDFVQGIINMRTCGVSMQIAGKQSLVHGDLIAVLCDTPAAAVLGGFKESSGWAQKMCRMCNASKDNFKVNFTEEHFCRRNMASHEEQCSLLESSALGRNRGHWSKAFGVNSRSVLCQIPGFDVTQQLLQDPMHVLLEGVFSHVAALFILDQIADDVFTLEQFNNWLSSLQYSYIDRSNKPFLVDKTQLKKSFVLKQKAATNLLLVHILPLFFGLHTDESSRKYSHYLVLVNIVQLVFCYRTDTTVAGILKDAINVFCQEFSVLYRDISVKPKMHFMVHLPQQLMTFGPLRQHSTMRFEGKHGFFKGQKVVNFVNLPKTLASRHQLDLAFNMSTGHGQLTGNYFCRGVEKGEGEICEVEDLSPVLRATLRSRGLSDSSVYMTSFVKKNGFTYKKGAVLLLSEGEVDMPAFGQVLDVFCDENVVFLAVTLLATQKFWKKFNSYEVVSQSILDVLDLAQLKHPWPIPMYTVNNKQLVTNRYTLFPGCL